MVNLKKTYQWSIWKKHFGLRCTSFVSGFVVFWKRLPMMSFFVVMLHYLFNNSANIKAEIGKVASKLKKGPNKVSSYIFLFGNKSDNSVCRPRVKYGPLIQ